MPPFSDPYCGPAPLPGQLWSAWNLDPVLLAALALSAVVLMRAPRRAWALAGWGVVALAFVSPLCALTAALFAGRAAHHLVIVTAAAPLLALGWPVGGRVGPWLAALVAVMAAWHWPPVYDAIWTSDAAYWAMQGAMMLAAWGFWSAALDNRKPVLPRAGAVAALAGGMGLLGAILAFAPVILFPQHIEGAALWGMTPLADQQLAGLVMWVPGFVPLAAAAAWMLRAGWRRGFAA